MHALLSPSHAVRVTIKANKSITVNEGDPLRVFCAAKGVPIPSVSLARGVDNPGGLNDVFNRNEEIFAVSKAVPEHAGIYYCFASQDTFPVDGPPTTINRIVTITVIVLGECIS